MNVNRVEAVEVDRMPHCPGEVSGVCYLKDYIPVLNMSLVHSLLSAVLVFFVYLILNMILSDKTVHLHQPHCGVPSDRGHI
jgi:hypothetical protein